MKLYLFLLGCMGSICCASRCMSCSKRTFCTMSIWFWTPFTLNCLLIWWRITWIERSISFSVILVCTALFMNKIVSVESHSKVEQWLKIFEGIVYESLHFERICLRLESLHRYVANTKVKTCAQRSCMICGRITSWRVRIIHTTKPSHKWKKKKSRVFVVSWLFDGLIAILNEWNEWRAKIDHCKQSKYYTETNYKKVLEENDHLSAFPETFHSSFLEFNYHFDVPKSGLLYQNVTDPYTSNESSVSSNQNMLKRRRVLESEPPPQQQQQSNNASMPSTVNRNRRVLMSSSTSSRAVLGSASSTRHLL